MQPIHKVQAPPKETNKKELEPIENPNQNISAVKIVQKEDQKIENTENKNAPIFKSIHIALIVGIIIIIAIIVALPFILSDLHKDSKNKEIVFYELNETNYIKTTTYENLVIPSNKSFKW